VRASIGGAAAAPGNTNAFCTRDDLDTPCIPCIAEGQSVPHQQCFGGPASQWSIVLLLLLLLLSRNPTATTFAQAFTFRHTLHAQQSRLQPKLAWGTATYAQNSLRYTLTCDVGHSNGSYS
jgi:hypothetical protein